MYYLKSVQIGFIHTPYFCKKFKNMKKLLLLIALATILCGCEKTSKTFYSFSTSNSLRELAGDMKIDVQINEYFGDDRVKINVIKDCIWEKEYKFAAEEYSEKIKIYVIIETVIDGFKFTIKQWIANVIYLEEGKTTEIILNENTLLSNHEP